MVYSRAKPHASQCNPMEVSKIREPATKHDESERATIEVGSPKAPDSKAAHNKYQRDEIVGKIDANINYQEYYSHLIHCNNPPHQVPLIQKTGFLVYVACGHVIRHHSTRGL